MAGSSLGVLRDPANSAIHSIGGEVLFEILCLVRVPRDFHSDVTNSDWGSVIRDNIRFTRKAAPDEGFAGKCISRLHHFASWGCGRRALD
jgi:hypothetical protein